MVPRPHPEEESTELPAQKGTLRISDTNRAIQPMYLYEPEKDDRDLHGDHMVYEPPQSSSSKWGPRPYSLSDIIFLYDTEDEGQRGYEHESQDRFHESHKHPFHQYQMYLDDRGRRSYVHTDTVDEQFYLQLQPRLQLEEGDWLEDYNFIRPGESSIRDKAYRNWYETTHPRPNSLDQVI